MCYNLQGRYIYDVPSQVESSSSCGPVYAELDFAG